MTEIPPYQEQENRFFGLPMQQNRLSAPLWDWMIEHEHAQRVIEIGSGVGGFTTCMGITMKAHAGRVYAFDVKEPPKQVLEWWSSLPVSFYKIDVFSPEGLTKIGHITRDNGTTIILCDACDRRREFKQFASFLKPGDIIAAHDYRHSRTWPFSEFTEVDAKDVMAANGLTRIPWGAIHQAGWFAARKL